MLDPEVLESLRCSTCRNYLSVFPINSYGGEQSVCGRCPVDENFCPQQAILYETVTKNMNFPCQYDMRGCPEKTTPDHMKNHEAKCSYRPFLCPVLREKCLFEGTIEDISLHFENDHPDDIFENVEVDIVNIYERNYIHWENNDIFVISFKCDKYEGNLYIQVKYLNNEKTAEKFSFLLTFSTKHKDSYDLMGNVTFSELRELDLHKPYHVVSITDLKNHLNNPTMIICNIEISRNRPTPSRSVSVFEEDLLRSIECPVCFCHMVPPILQCERGHSFCKSCHEKLDTCPVCRQSMSNIQNFVLEALTLKIGYPCKYQQFDCAYFGSANEIRQHEKNCPFGPFQCLFEHCKWKDRFEKLLGHVRVAHHDNYLDVNTVTHFIDHSCNEAEIYVISKFGNLFKIVFKEDTAAFRWSLQLVGPDIDPSKYILELDIKSPVNFERIYYKKTCQCLTRDEDAFRNRDTYIELTREALVGMIDGDTLSYYCNVAQI